MWIKKLKKKKVQYIVIGLILACITAIFTGCLSFNFGIKEFSQSYYTREKVPEFFFVSRGEEGKKSLEEFEEEENHFKKLFFQKGKAVDGIVQLNGKKLPLNLAGIYQIKDVEEIPFDFHANGELAKLRKPDKGTVWIPSVYADLKNIKTGDEISFQGRERYSLKVAGTYNSAICPSSSMAFYPFFVNEAELELLSDLETVYFGCFIRNSFQEPLSDFIERLPREMNDSLLMQVDLDMLKLTLEMTTMLMAGIGMAASVLIFLVSIVIIRFIIKSNLVKEYKSIGIYKALGFQNSEIVGFYLKCYLFTGLISIMIGAFLGLPMSQYLGAMSIRYLENYEISSKSLAMVLLAGGILFIILTVSMFFALRKIKKMNPVNALNMEMTSSKAKMKKSIIKNAHSPLAMAVNDIFKHKSMSIMILLVLTVAFYLCIFFMMVNNTGRQLGKDTAVWFGIPNTGCYVTAPMNDGMRRKIENSPYVSKAIYGQLYQLINIENTSGDTVLNNCTVFSYDDFAEDVTGVRYNKGRAPSGHGEMAFSSQLMAQLGSRVGDYIGLKINGMEGEYLIAGSFDTMMNGGECIQIPNKVLDACEVDYANDIAFVKLKEESDFKLFKKEMKQNTDNVDVTNQLTVLTDSAEGITEIIVPITTILVIIFISFSLLNIINLLIMNNIDNRKKFGILKALGFTNGYIMMQNIFKILILSLSSSAVGMLIHFSFSAKLFKALVSVDGLTDSIPMLVGLVGGMLLLIVFASIMFTLPLQKITPTELMEE